MIKKEYIFLFVITALVALCPYFYPIEGDDFIYSFTMDDTDRRVVDFAGVFEGVANCMKIVNGRTFCNFMVFTFVNLVPQWGMYVLAFITMLLTFIAFTCKDSLLKIFPVLFCIFWIFCPDIDDTLKWKSGFMNYAFPGMLNMLYIWLLSKSRSIPNYCKLYLPLFAFFVGSLHEGASLPICGALILFCFFNLSKLQKNDLLLIIPYFLGTILILATPGTFARVGMAGTEHKLHLIPFLSNIMALGALVILIVLRWINRKKEAGITKYIMLLQFSLVFGLLLFAVLTLISGMPEQRYFYFVHIFAVALIAQELIAIDLFKSLKTNVFFTLLAFALVGISIYNTLDKKAIAEREMQLFASTTDYVVPADFTDLHSDTTSYSNHLIATYFNKPYLIAYPSPIYYHLYLNEDAPSAPFSTEWKQVSETIFARKMQSPTDIQEVTMTKVIDFPILSSKKFTSSPQSSVFQSKSGTYYQVVTNSKSHTKVIAIN